jgi:CheY-like chemotaxis protein
VNTQKHSHSVIRSRPIILCVDDQQTGLELRKRVLENAGYSVLTATSAQQALEIFGTNHVDLVLTEHPTIVGGPALAATMKMLKPEVPVAVLSADMSEWPEDRRFADVFITKLVPVDDLLRAIEKSLLSRVQHDWDAVRFAVHTRTLMPSHLYQTSVLAWQCSVCQKIFCRTLDEAERECCRINPPGYIEREFRFHNCVLVLVARQEKYDAD